MRRKVEDPIIWYYWFKKDFPNKIAENATEIIDWKDKYKQSFLELHALTIELSITPTEVKEGDQVTVKIQLHNRSPHINQKSLKVTVGDDCDFLPEGAFLRTFGLKKNGKPKTQHTVFTAEYAGIGFAHFAFFQKAIPSYLSIFGTVLTRPKYINVEISYSCTFAGTIKKFKNPKTKKNVFGILVDGSLGLGCFLPLSVPEGENKVWVELENDKGVDDSVWKGKAKSNVVVLHVKPTVLNVIESLFGYRF